MNEEVSFWMRRYISGLLFGDETEIHWKYRQKTFYLRKERPAKTIDLGGNILR